MIGLVLFIAGDLMRQGSVVVDGASTKLHLLGQAVRNHPNVDVRILGRSFPILLVALEMDELIALPFHETERPNPDRVAVKLAIPQAERSLRGLRETPGVHFLLQRVFVQQVLGQNPHSPPCNRR